MNKKKTGLFFGSFDPVHVGHLLIGGHLLAFGYVEEVWFVVSPQSPFKTGNLLSNAQDRVKMLTLAVEDEPLMDVCDIELSMPNPSYTIDTLNKLRELYPERIFSIIMGEDNLKGFENWKEYDKIITNYEILVYPRVNSELGNKILLPNCRILEAPVVDISSTLIRELIANGHEVSVFLCERVEKYIKECKLYR